MGCSGAGKTGTGGKLIGDEQYEAVSGCARIYWFAHLSRA